MKANQRRVALDDATIRAVSPPAAGRISISDAEVPGLSIRITASGAKTFSYKFWLKDEARHERITLGRFPKLRTDRARTLAQVHAAAVARGENPALALREKRRETTLGELFALFMERHARLHKRTAQSDQDIFDRYLKPLAEKPLSKVTPRDIGDLMQRATQTRCGRASNGGRTTANRIRSLISTMFTKATKWGHFTGANPATAVEKFKEHTRRRFIRRDEMRPFWLAIQHEPIQTWRDFFALAVLTGVRRGNLQETRWVNVRLDRAEWHLPTTKNGEEQTVTLVPEAVEILRRRRESCEGEFVFPAGTRSGHIAEPMDAWRRLKSRMELFGVMLAVASKRGLPEAETDTLISEAASGPLRHALAQWRDIAAKEGVDASQFVVADLRIHDLRRTLGSWQARAGASLLVIGRSLNHRSPQSTAIYARLDLDPVRESVTRATSAMLEAAGVKPSASVVDINSRPEKSAA